MRLLYEWQMIQYVAKEVRVFCKLRSQGGVELFLVDSFKIREEGSDLRSIYRSGIGRLRITHIVPDQIALVFEYPGDLLSHSGFKIIFPDGRKYGE